MVWFSFYERISTSWFYFKFMIWNDFISTFWNCFNFIKWFLFIWFELHEIIYTLWLHSDFVISIDFIFNFMIETFQDNFHLFDLNFRIRNNLIPILWNGLHFMIWNNFISNDFYFMISFWLCNWNFIKWFGFYDLIWTLWSHLKEFQLYKMNSSL